jgi:DNA replication protein DnaC
MKTIHDYLNTLKLSKMADVLDQELARAEKEKRSTVEVLERLFCLEVAGLMERRIERRIRESRLPERKLLADFDFEFQTGLDQKQVMDLATLGFIHRKEWLLMAGCSGTGKSHIAKSLLLIACQENFRCRYTTASDMLQTLLSGLADGTLELKLKSYIRPEVLLIDEIGFDRLEQNDARKASLFFKVVEARYCKNTTILTTNIDFKAMGEYLGDPVVTTALLDRLVHHAIIINIDGPSYRMYESKALNRKKEK